MPDVERFPGLQRSSRDGGPAGSVNVTVPPAPGVVPVRSRSTWNPRVGGNRSAGVRCRSHFDDGRPAPASDHRARPGSRPGTVVPIQLSPPAAPLPISGIAGLRGLDRPARRRVPRAHAPTAARAAEIDLPAGIGDDPLDPCRRPPEGHLLRPRGRRLGLGMTVGAAPRRVALGVDGTPPLVAPRRRAVRLGRGAGPVDRDRHRSALRDGRRRAGRTGDRDRRRRRAAAGSSPGAAASATVTGQGTHRVVYWGRDAVGNAGDGSLPLSPPTTATIRIDETDPVVRFAAGDPGDPERIEATVADELSGPALGRGAIAIRPVGSTGASSRCRPTPSAAALVARWNSDDFPRGAYEFRAVGFDAAGNSASNLARRRRARCVLDNPVKREARVAFGFGAAALVFQRCARSRRQPPLPPRRSCTPSRGARRPAPSPAATAPWSAAVWSTPPGRRWRARRSKWSRRFAGGARHADPAHPGHHRRRRRLQRPARAGAEPRGQRRVPRHPSPHPRRRPPAAAAGPGRGPPARLDLAGAGRRRAGRLPRPHRPSGSAGSRPAACRSSSSSGCRGWPGPSSAPCRATPPGAFRYPYSFSDDDSAGVRFLFRAFVPATGGWPFAPGHLAAARRHRLSRAPRKRPPRRTRGGLDCGWRRRT